MKDADNAGYVEIARVGIPEAAGSLGLVGDFLSNFAGGLAVAAVLGLVAWRWPAIKGWWGRLRVERAARRASKAEAKAKADREGAIAAAKAEGRVVEVARSGRCPVRVELSDGTCRYYFCGDLAAYKQALESGQDPPRTTFHTSPPQLRS